MTLDSRSTPTRTDPEAASDVDSTDARVADLLARAERHPRGLRGVLAEEGGRLSSRVRARLETLDHLEALVGSEAPLPERLGAYRITGLLGRGGMGTVFCAFHETLEREVALKVLSPAFSSDARMRQRFRTEARATAALHHQHIVPIYDYGELDGVLFFAMEKVDGVSLDKLIEAARRRGRPAMAPLEAARKFAGVASALAHAHKRRILHRDVKPGNLLVNPDGSLALADFGLSKMLGEQSLGLTGGHSFVGTLLYASPEQAKGEELTPGSDLYSLGVTMFEAVTGELPLRAGTAEAMLQELLHGEPRRLRQLRPEAPRDLEAVLDKLGRKNPIERYTDGEALARDLMRVAEGEPIRIRRQSWVMRTWRRVKRNPGMALAVVSVVVLAVLALTLLQANVRERARSKVSRHANLLQRAMTAAMREVGPAAGPPGLFEALAGAPAGDGVPAGRGEVLAALEEAQRLFPEDVRAAALRRAYEVDPVPAATQALREGRGYWALVLLDRALDEARPGREARDDVTWLRLYRLYVARAVAALTAAVGRPEQAAMDLVRASMVRPGAFFPRLLQAVLEWRAAGETGDGEALHRRLERLTASGPSGAREVAAWIELTLSGVRRAPGANLMAFALNGATRRALYRRARAVLAGHPRWPQEGPRWTGFERLLADAAAAGIAARGDSAAIAAHVRRGRELLQQVHPDSPLQSWAYVFNVLADPGPHPMVLASGRRLPRALQIRAWDDLLALGPSPEQLAPMRAWVEPLIAAPRDVAELRVAARFQARLGKARAALEAAQRWYEADPLDPQAMLARFEALAQAGEGAQACVVAAALLREAPDRALAHRALVARLGELLAAAGERAPTELAQLQALLEKD